MSDDKEKVTKESDFDPVILGFHDWSVKDLVTRFPPVWSHPNKQAIAEIATPPNTQHTGSLMVSRWKQNDKFPFNMICCLPLNTIQQKDGFFTYPENDDPNHKTHWHMNFADPVVFAYGESALLAQDELQIVEHPALASLHKALEHEQGLDEGLKPWTVLDASNYYHHVATPILVQGVPRRCQLDVKDDLYGNAFAAASRTLVQSRTTPLQPPTYSNILALAALPPCSGYYTAEQISDLFHSAYTGFRAIVIQSHPLKVVLHTGYWGCGAFGGNKGLVAAIQLLAAGLAGIDQVQFWRGYTTLDHTALEHAMEVAQTLEGLSVREAIEKLAAAGYTWGVANENYVPYQPPHNGFLSS